MEKGKRWDIGRRLPPLAVCCLFSVDDEILN